MDDDSTQPDGIALSSGPYDSGTSDFAPNQGCVAISPSPSAAKPSPSCRSFFVCLWLVSSQCYFQTTVFSLIF